MDYAYGHVLYERVRKLKIYDNKTLFELMRQGMKNYNDPSSEFQHQIDLTVRGHTWSYVLYDRNVREELTWKMWVYILLQIIIFVGVLVIIVGSVRAYVYNRT